MQFNKKDKGCYASNSIENRQKQAELFRKLTENTLKERILKLQQICWGRNRRRMEHSKPTNLPKQDPKLGVNCYSRLVQFRMQPVEMIWLELVRLVSLMIGVYGAMQKRGCMLERLTYRNIMDQYKTAVNVSDLGVETSAVNVNYNYKDYAATKKILVPLNAVKVMLKNENLRTHEDIMLIYTLMMNLPVFQNSYSHHLKWALAKNLKYFKCEAKRVLTAKNRNPIRVYFIYSGSVNVVVESEDILGSVKRTISLPRGSCIGHTLKSSHCICATDCEFLTIDKSVYIEEGIHSVESQKLEERFDFFRNWKPLEDWSDNAIYDLANLSYTDSYPSGTLILQDRMDEELDLVWFVLSGKIDVVKVVSCYDYHMSVSTKKKFFDKKAKISRMYDVTLKNIVPKNQKELNKCQKKHQKSNEAIGLQSTNTLSKLRFEKNKSVYSNTNVEGDFPIYLRMRTLCQGECYGLDNIEDDRFKLRIGDDLKSTNRFCLVSRDCKLIRLSCSHFKNLIQILGVNKSEIIQAMHSYYDNTQIYKRMEKEIQWKIYKQDCVESLVVQNPSGRKSMNFSNHLKHTRNNLGLASFNQSNYMFPLKKVTPGGMKIVNPLHSIVHHPIMKDVRTRCLQ